MSNTPGISPLTSDLEKIRHSDEDEDEALIGEDGGLFDDPDAVDEEDDEDEPSGGHGEERDDV